MYESDALKERMVMTKTEWFLILQIIDNCSLIKIKSSTSSFYFDKGASGRFDFYQVFDIETLQEPACIKLWNFPRCFLSSKNLVSMPSSYMFVWWYFYFTLNAPYISFLFFIIAGPICFGNFYGSER